RRGAGPADPSCARAAGARTEPGPAPARTATHRFPSKPPRMHPHGCMAPSGSTTGMSAERIPMSKEGYDKLKAQLDKMKNEDMPRIAEQIAQARGYGDLTENAEYEAAMESQGM